MYTVLIPEKADSFEGTRDRLSEREKETYIKKYRQRTEKKTENCRGSYDVLKVF